MAKLKITVERGKSYGFALEITDEDTGEQYALQSGETLRFGVKARTGDPNYLILKEDTSADADEDGRYPIFINPTDTINLPTGTYHYDVGLQSGDDYWPIINWSDFVIGPNATTKGA